MAGKVTALTLYAVITPIVPAYFSSIILSNSSLLPCSHLPAGVIDAALSLVWSPWLRPSLTSLVYVPSGSLTLRTEELSLPHTLLTSHH